MHISEADPLAGWLLVRNCLLRSIWKLHTGQGCFRPRGVIKSWGLKLDCCHLAEQVAPDSPSYLQQQA